MTSSQTPSPDGDRRWRVRGRAYRLAVKELRETLRDRRTLMTLILMPLLVYPLLGVILQKVLLTTMSAPSDVSYSIALCSPADVDRFRQLYRQGDRLLPKSVPRRDIRTIAPHNPDQACRPAKWVSDGEADLAIVFRGTRGNPGGGPKAPYPLPAKIELIYEQGNSRAQTVVLSVQQRLQAVNNDYARRLLKRTRPADPGPADVVMRILKRPPSAKFSLATFVPLMLILMTVTGAVYPAIDLTAGERERGTLEVLVAAPVPRLELLGAKFVAVLTVAILTAIVNLSAMLVTVYASGLEKLVFGDLGFSWVVMGQILALLCLFAAFFSAVLLALTSFARSFKEAQAYLIPLMLVALAPGVFSLTPGLKMSGLLAVTPLINIVLLGRDLFEGRMVPKLFAWAVISTALYALMALGIAARVFGSDAILYGSQGSVRDLFRRPKETHPVPSLTQVMFALAVLFPAFVVLSSLPGRISNVSMSARLCVSAGITIFLFAFWPLVMTWRNNVRNRTAFRTALPSAWAWLVALVWGLSLWTWAYELEILTLTPQRMGVLRLLFQMLKIQLGTVPLGWQLAALAVVPAICEEWFFRGYLMSGLRTRLSPVQAVLASAALFGLFHVIVRDMLFFERFLPSGFLGLMLGWLAVRTGSVWPGMLLHVLHNSFLLTLAAYQKELMALNIGLAPQKHLPWTWLAGSAALIFVGGAVLVRLRSKVRIHPDPVPDLEANLTSPQPGLPSGG